MICVDASVAVKWVLQEDRADRARHLYREAVEAREAIVAPPLMPVEVTNILRQRMRVADGLVLGEAITLLEDFLDFRFITRNPPRLHRQALTIADAYGLPAAYDAHYVALAEFLGCDLWTDDVRLPRHVGTRLPFVRWIGDYAIPSRP